MNLWVTPVPGPSLLALLGMMGTSPEGDPGDVSDYYASYEIVTTLPVERPPLVPSLWERRTSLVIPPGLERLTEAAEALMGGARDGMDRVQILCEAGGYPCDMVIALEGKVLPGVTVEESLEILRRMEARFDEWVRSRNQASREAKSVRVAPYLATALPMGVTINPGDPIALEKFHRLILIHEFLVQEPKIRENFEERKNQTFLVDFLAGNADRFTQGGSCYPMMLLAVQLGRRIGLRLEPRWSEDHVSVWADIGQGLLYEPFWGSADPLRVFFRPDMHRLASRAPQDVSFLSLAEIVVNQTLSYPLMMDQAQRRNHEVLRRFSRLLILVPQLSHAWFNWGWMILHFGDEDWAEEVVKSGLISFPDSIWGNLLLAKIHLKKGRSTEALALLREVAKAMVEREIYAQQVAMPVLRPSGEERTLFYFLWGRYLEMEKGDLQSALDLYKLAIKQQSRDLTLKIEIAKALARITSKVK